MLTYALESGDNGGEASLECYFKNGSEKVNRYTWSKWVTSEQATETIYITVPDIYDDGTPQEVECSITLFKIFKAKSSGTFMFIHEEIGGGGIGKQDFKTKLQKYGAETFMMIPAYLDFIPMQFVYVGLIFLSVVIAVFIGWKKQKKKKEEKTKTEKEY